MIRESIRKSIGVWRRDTLTVMRVIFKRYTFTKRIASANVSMKEFQYNFGIANVLVL